MVAFRPMKIAFARALLRLLALLPLAAARMLARALAGISGLLPWRGHRRLDDNLRRAFPELNAVERRRLARDNRSAMLATVLESGGLWRRRRDWIEQRIVSVDARDPMDAALAHGRGVLVLGGHLGQWELSILYGSLNFPIAYLYKPPRSDELDRLLTAHRARFGAEMIPTGGAALRRALRQLRGGGALGLLFDQLPRAGDSRSVPFFGQTVATMTLPHRLIRATGCEVVMGHCLRGPGGWRIVFDPVPGAADPDPDTALAAMNHALEQRIRTAPEQYLWHYKRFDALIDRGA